MSILINGMKMPEGCVVCPFAERIPPGRTRCLITRRMLSDGYHAPSAWRNECCPLVEIPPHGRLIDAEALMQTYCRHEFSSDMGDAMEILENYPTVIEAEWD